MLSPHTKMYANIQIYIAIEDENLLQFGVPSLPHGIYEVNEHERKPVRRELKFQ